MVRQVICSLLEGFIHLFRHIRFRCHRDAGLIASARNQGILTLGEFHLILFAVQIEPVEKALHRLRFKIPSKIDHDIICTEFFRSSRHLKIEILHKLHLDRRIHKCLYGLRL